MSEETKEEVKEKVEEEKKEVQQESPKEESAAEEKKEEPEEEITIKKDSLWKSASFIFAVLLVISLFTGGFGLGSSGDGVTGQAVAVPDNVPPSNAPTPSPAPVKVEIDDDDVLGSEDAPVTMIEFSDYECPFCARYFTQTYDQIKKTYVDTGKVKIVFRDFPLSFHPKAQKAAEAAECAGEQGKYWEMHDKLFENQQTLDIISLKRYANEIGLNIAEFSPCLDSGQMAAEVKKDFSDGQAAGVRGTPAFFINGRLISGAQPFSAFQQAIDAELA